MPTIFPISDIHLEFHKDGGKSLLKELPVDGVDILVIAGDLGRFDGANQKDYSDFFWGVASKYKDVVLVPGNHEYWGISPPIAYANFSKWVYCEKYGYGGVHIFFTPGAEVIQGLKFVAGTMWFPEPSPLDWHWASRWTDFKQIYRTPRQTSAEWIYEQYKLFQNVLWGEEDIDVVVTHHAPSYKSVEDRFRGSPDNIFFVSKCDDAIVEKKPKVWIHGHMHHASDYMIENTRVVCNPFGYVGYDLHEPYRPDVRVIL